MFKELLHNIFKGKSTEKTRTLSERQEFAKRLKLDPSLVSSEFGRINSYLMEDVNRLIPYAGEISIGRRVETLEDEYNIIPTAFLVRVITRDKGLFDVHWDRSNVTFFARNDFKDQRGKYNLEQKRGNIINVGDFVGGFVVDFHDIVVDISNERNETSNSKSK
jgi:hypothetical protein